MLNFELKQIIFFIDLCIKFKFITINLDLIINNEILLSGYSYYRRIIQL